MTSKTEYADIESALAAAEARIAAVAAEGRPNLIETIPVEDFVDWDGSGEMALVGPGRDASA